MESQCREVNMRQTDVQECVDIVVGAEEVEEDITTGDIIDHQEILKALAKRRVTTKMIMINLRQMKNHEDHTDVDEDADVEDTVVVEVTVDDQEVTDPETMEIHLKMKDVKAITKENQKEGKTAEIEEDPGDTVDDPGDHHHRALVTKVIETTATATVIEVSKKSVVNEVVTVVVVVVVETDDEDALEETSAHATLEVKEKRLKGVVHQRNKINNQTTPRPPKFKLKLNLYFS